MDLNDIDKQTELIIMIIKKLFTLPFLLVLGAGSRVFYEYLQNKKMPTTHDILAISVLATMTTLVTYLSMTAMEYDKKWVEIAVLVMAFIGHTAATWLLENWTKYLPFKKKEEEKK